MSVALHIIVIDLLHFMSWRFLPIPISYIDGSNVFCLFLFYFILFYVMLGQIFHLFFSSFLIDVFLFLLEEIVELCL